jgi:magnesium-transporting ATPase (P-type)
MARPPKRRNERLLNWPLLLRSYLFLGLLEALAAMTTYYFVLHGGGWSWGESLGTENKLYQQATTACLASIIIMQIVNVFLCKTPERSLFGSTIFSNQLILWGVALELTLILSIVYTPWGQIIFGTAAIEANVWLFMLPFAAGMLLLEEVRKWVSIKWLR